MSKENKENLDLTEGELNEEDFEEISSLFEKMIDQVEEEEYSPSSLPKLLPQIEEAVEEESGKKIKRRGRPKKIKIPKSIPVPRQLKKVLGKRIQEEEDELVPIQISLSRRLINELEKFGRDDPSFTLLAGSKPSRSAIIRLLLARALYK